MDAARITSVVNRGYGIAARKIGPVFDVYRPSTATADPIVPLNKVRTLNATFVVAGKGYVFNKALTSGDAWVHGLLDPTNLEIGDYFVNADHGTFFLSGTGHILPILCVACTQNRITIARPNTAASFGLNGYGGSMPSNEDDILVDWPASLRIGGSARPGGGDDLPMDVGVGDWGLILPPLPGGVTIRSSDVLTDEMNTRFIIGACELTQYGWDIKLTQAVT